jgi:hypothetical protein
VSTYEVTRYGVTYCTVPVGVRGVAVRLGRALENWGSEPTTPIDPTALRRELRRQDEVKTRMISDRLTFRQW